MPSFKSHKLHFATEILITRIESHIAPQKSTLWLHQGTRLSSQASAHQLSTNHAASQQEHGCASMVASNLASNRSEWWKNFTATRALKFNSLNFSRPSAFSESDRQINSLQRGEKKFSLN